MKSSFTAEFFASNRRRLLGLVGDDDLIVIAGNGLLQRNADETYMFRQDSSFWYLTGLDRPDLTLVMSTKETYLIVPAMSAENEAFDGAYDLEEFTRLSGIAKVVGAREGWSSLKSEITKSHRVLTLGSPPERIKRQNFYTSPSRRRLIARLRRLDSVVKIIDVRPQLAALRVIKQPSEIHALQQAIDITAETIAQVRRPDFLKTVEHEYDVEAAINYGFRRRGASGAAFSSVVGAGANSTTLHHNDNSGLIGSSDLIVLDVGAEVEHYAADVTRTVVSEKPTDRQKAIHQAVLEVQQAAFDWLKPGLTMREHEISAAQRVGQKLQSLGLIKSIDRSSIRCYFPHATSHFLGLDVHDVGNYDQPLTPGMVITVEPGIYVPEEGLGVRLEDDVLITETGIEILSKTCPRDLFSGTL